MRTLKLPMSLVPLRTGDLAHVTGGDLPVIAVTGVSLTGWTDISIYKPPPPQPWGSWSTVSSALLTNVAVYR